MIRLSISILFISSLVFTACKSNKVYKEQTEKAEMDGVQQAIEQEFFMTRDLRTNTVPVERLEVARNYMKNLVSTSRLTDIAALTWQERGPNNVGGRTRAIMIDKRDATGNTVFAGSVGGGMFKTTNFTSASVTWTAVNDFLPNLAITNIIQDAAHPDTLFATTGEGWFNIDAIRGAGVYKSINGGATWTQLASTANFEYVQDLVIDNSGNLYVSLRNLTTTDSRGVWRSTNRGAAWTQVLGLPLVNFVTGRAADLEVASNGDIYATLGIFTRGSVFKSSFATHGANTGAPGTWQEITPVRFNITQRLELAIAPSNSQKLYLLMQDSANDNQVTGIFRSPNGGSTWDSLGAPGELNNGTNSQTWYNLIAAVSPTNENILVVGGLNLAKSTDGGNNWTGISTSASVHVDQHVLVYDGDSKLLVGNDGGIYYSENANTASPTFTNKNNGYNITQYYGVDLHPTSANYFLAGAQDNGTQKFTSSGINTTTTAVGGDGGWPHIDQTDGQLQIVSLTGNNYRFSTNGGATFVNAGAVNNNRGQFINPTDFDDNTDILYCGDDEGKYYFIRNWTTTPTGTQVTIAGFGAREVTFVKVDPAGGNNVWVGLSPVNANTLPMVVKLDNANTATPGFASFGFVGNVNGAALSSLDIDPNNANHIIATLSNYGVVSIWESIDGGSTFSSIEGNLPDMPVWWCMFAPQGAQLNGPTGGSGGILLGTDVGVWTTSLISGATTQWIPNNSGLANIRVYMLKYRPSDHTVAAATHGRGLFTTVLQGVTTGLPNIPNTKDFIKYVSVENSQMQVVVGNFQTKTITLQLFDMNGRLMLQRRQQYENVLLDLSRYNSGSYIIKITGDKNERFVKHVIR